MKHCNASENQITRRILPIAGAAALAIAFTVSLPQPAHAADVTPPPVPAKLEVEAGHKAFLVGRAIGTQNYVCLPSGNGFAYSLFTPQATLFNDDGQQIITHFFSPNPVEGGVVRASWQHSRDTSAVWAQVTPDGSSSDPDFVAPGAIPWLLLNVKDTGAQAGPTGGQKLTRTTFIQRVNTVGGVAPPTGCAQSADVGRREFVPYRADYFFYFDADGDDDN